MVAVGKKKTGRPRVANPRVHKVVAHLTEVERQELEELRRRLPYEPDVAAVVRAAVLQFLAQARTTDKTD